MRQYFPLLFFIIFIGILVAANIYLSRRYNFYFNLENTKVLFFIFPALSFLILFGMIPLSNTTSGFGSLVYMISAITMGVLLYLLLTVLALEILNLFPKISPKTIGFSALIITGIIVFSGTLNSWNVQVTKQKIVVKGLTREVRAMHLSDIHIGHFRGKKFLKKIVDKTNKQNVDIVFITGDLFDGKINLTLDELAPLKQLKVPIYFVEGNHDKYSGVSTIKEYLRQLNVHVLENEVETWNELQIIGLNHMAADNESFNMHASAGKATIKSTLKKLAPDQSKPAVLLHHSPDGIKYASQHGVDLYLAGHTHAGQMFLVKYIANLLFDYNKGLHEYEGTKIFVSQGAGTFGPPMRIGTKSEITVLTLKPE